MRDNRLIEIERSRSTIPLGIAFCLLLAGGCSTSAPPAIDLSPARRAVEAASGSAQGEEARAAADRARHRLAQAEALASAADADSRNRAAILAELAIVEAQCATLLDKVVRLAPVSGPPAAQHAADTEAEALRVRLRRASEEQKRLEERGAVLQRDLEATETELIRTKAKLKGIETKAEASSVIAEARILLLRRQDEKKRTADIARAEDKIERAERQLREANYGAAVFFALQAQELLENGAKGREKPSAGTGGGPPRLSVAVSSALVRREPKAGASVAGRLPRGTALELLEERDGWVRVEVGGVSGWVSRTVLEPSR